MKRLADALNAFSCQAHPDRCLPKRKLIASHNIPPVKRRRLPGKGYDDNVQKTTCIA
jgi:hypothetical protein